GLKGGYFDQAGQVAAGPDGNGDMGDVHVENLHIFVVHADAIHVGNLVPEFEGNDEVDLFFLADAFDAEHGGDIDDADAADLHVVAGQLRAGADDLAAIDQGHLGDVVGHEAVAALDQGEHAFAFADAALAADDNADAEDVHHAAHLGAMRGEHHFKRQRGEIDELHGDERALEDGDVCLLGDFQHQPVRVLVPAVDDAGDFVGAKSGVAALAFLGREGCQVKGRGVADDLHALVGEITGEAGEDEARPVHGGFANDALEAAGAGEEFQFQRAGLFRVKAFNCDDVPLHSVSAAAM